MASETDALREGNWWKLTAVHENDGQYAWPLGENSVLQEHLAEFNFFWSGTLKIYTEEGTIEYKEKTKLPLLV